MLPGQPQLVPMLEWRRILLATDFSACSEKATEVAIDLALKVGAELTVMHVFEIPAYVGMGTTFSPVDILTPIRDAELASLAKALAHVRQRVPNAQSRFEDGNPTDRIVAAAADLPADLLVVGTHGRRGASHLLLGSVAERVVRLSAVPVLTIRGPRHAPKSA